MDCRASRLAVIMAAALAAGSAAWAQAPAAPASIDDILNQATIIETVQPAPAPTQAYSNTELLDVHIRGASAAAQVMQGPLDGAWSLEDASGAPLYSFQFVHAAGPVNALEGAWRDHRRGEGLAGTGLIDDVRRSANTLEARFNPKAGAETALVTLVETVGGSWTGQLIQAGVTTPVRMVRTEPMLAVEPIRAVTAGVVSPYRTPVNAPPPRRR